MNSKANASPVYEKENDDIIGVYKPVRIGGTAIGRVANFNWFVSKDETVGDLADALVKNDDIYAICVVNDDYQVQGIIVRRELFNLLGDSEEREKYSRRTVVSVMKAVSTFHYMADSFVIADEIASSMSKPTMTYYVLVREEDKFAGIFSSKDILLFMSEVTQKDIEMARSLQCSIVKEEKFENHECVDIVGATKMAKGIGGDFYDFKKVDDENLIIVLCDAIGKGIAASIIPSLIGGMAYVYDFRRGGVRRYVKMLNNYFSNNFGTEIFITGVFSSVNTNSREVILYDTGHSFIFVHRDGKLHRLSTCEENIPLGITADTEYRGMKFLGKEGDIIVMLTDGIPEQLIYDGTKYGEKRIGELIDRYRDLGVKRIKDEIFAEVADYRGTIPQQDDMTVIVMEIK